MRDLLIVGGGAAGLLTAIHALHAAVEPLRVTIVESRSDLGQGIAYSTKDPGHLLNVVAGRMSAFDDDPDHFVRFLSTLATDDSASDSATVATRFVARMQFAAYLRSTLSTQRGGIGIEWIRDEVVDIERGPPFVVSLRSGGNLTARSVVLAIGNFARGIPLPDSAIGAELPIVSAWDYADVRAIEPDADVCIVGSGLSMVDAVISLAANGHRGRMIVVSRHGLMPLSHARPGKQDGNIADLPGLGVRKLMRAIRSQARAAQAKGEPWQWTMDRLRPHGEALWRSLAPTEQRRFLRHASRFWDIHRHRIAPSISARVNQLRSTGQLKVLAGHLTSIAQTVAGTSVSFRPRHGRGAQSIIADCVINSTGMESNLQRVGHPLLQSLIRRGLIRPGAHGMGMDSDDSGFVVGVDGEPIEGLLTLGSMRVGQLWESIAIPELRMQAERIGRHLRERVERSKTRVIS